MICRSNLGVAGVVAVAGLATSAMASLPVSPTDIITWGGTGQGRAVPTPGGFTWAWNNTAPSPVIDGNGRVWFSGFVTSTPTIGSISAAQGPRGFFTATNSTDIELFGGLYDSAPLGGGVLAGQQSSAGVFNQTAFNTLRVSGSRVGLGLGIQGTGIVNSGAGQNNSDYRTGTYAGGVSVAQSRNQGISLIDGSGAPAIGDQAIDFKSIGQAHGFNAAGSLAWGGSVAAATGGAGGVGQFLTTTPTTAPFGNAGFVATRDSAGTTTVIAQAGQTAPGGGIYANGGTNGVRGNNVKMSRSGQVYFDSTMVITGAVNTGNDSRSFVYTPGVGSTRIYREGAPAPDASGAPDAGGALFTGAANVGFRGFSDAGAVLVGGLSSGDVTTADPLTNNSQGVYVATTGGTTRIARRNDLAPGFSAGDNVRIGAINTSAAGINNNGFVTFTAALQGESVIASRNAQFNFANPPQITATGQYGNDAAIFAGTAGDLRTIIRDGQAALGLPGYTVDFEAGSVSPVFNNLNQVMFTVNTGLYQPGDVIGVVGQPASSLDAFRGPRQLYGWSLDFGLVPLLNEGQQIEVETGVFKTLSTWVLSNQANEDGAGLGFNDNGQFVVQLKFTDNSWAVATLQVPAPGAGLLGLMGVAALARRRRR